LKQSKNVHFVKNNGRMNSIKLKDMKQNLVGTSNAIYGKGESLKSNSMKILEEESIQTTSSKQLSS